MTQLRFPHKSETKSNFIQSKRVVKDVIGASARHLRPAIRVRESAADDRQRLGSGLKHPLQRNSPVRVQILGFKQNGNNFVLAETGGEIPALRRLDFMEPPFCNLLASRSKPSLRFHFHARFTIALLSAIGMTARFTAQSNGFHETRRCVSRG
jgi:hypothetical protein